MSRNRVWEAVILESGSSFVVGDVHGQYLPLLRLLQNTGFLEGLRWAGDNRRLWFVGDLFDRGPDGLAVVNLVMRLEREARQTSGQVSAILGNHEVMLLAAYHFGGLGHGPHSDFFHLWQNAGGRLDDMVDLRPDHIGWLSNLPAMAVVNDHLILHSDAVGYARYGSSIEEVNTAIRSVLNGQDVAAWSVLMADLNGRDGFLGEAGLAQAQRLLRRFGGQRIVHGHTPIALMTNTRLDGAFVYADGLCINVDGGFSSQHPGFVHRLEPVQQSQTASETV